MSRLQGIGVWLVITVAAGGGAALLNGALAFVVAPGGEVPAPGRLVEPGQGLSPQQNAGGTLVRGKSEATYLEGILCRNLLDPTAVGDCKAKIGAAAGVDGQITDLPLSLVGTMVAEPASLSVAFIAIEGQETGSYGVNDQLLDATVRTILKNRVMIRRGDGSEEWLALGDEPVKVVSNDDDTTGAADPDGEVTQLGENRYAISRETLMKYLTDMEGLSKMGRAMLHRGTDGNYDGYRLSAIRRGTIADKLGIRNGDVIHGVNGASLNSMQAAMEAYQNLSGESKFSLEVSRRGERTTLEYEIR